MSDTNTTTKRQLQTRISLKIDTWEAWHDESVTGKGANLILARGEVAFVQIGSIPPGTTDQVIDTVLFKVGDGTSKFSELQWGSAIAADVYDWAKATKEEFYQALTGKEDATGTETFVVTTDFNEFKTSVIGSSKDTSNTKTVFQRIEAVEALLGDGGTVADTYATKQELSDTKDELFGKTDGDGKVISGNTILSAKADAAAVSSALNALSTGAVKSNTDAIAVLNGTAAQTGSVAKAVADAKTELKGTKATGDTTAETIAGAKVYADNIKTSLLGEAGKTGESTINSLRTDLASTDAKLTDLTGATVQASINTAKTDLVGDTTPTVSGMGNITSITSTAPDTITGAKQYAIDVVKALLNAYILDETDGVSPDAVDKLIEIAAWITDDKAGAAKIIADLSLKHNTSDFDEWVTSTFNPVSAKAHEHNNFDLLETYTQTESDLSDAVSKMHEHENKEVLDGISDDDVATWNATSANAHTDDDVFYIDCGTSTVNAFLVEVE